MKIKSYFAGTVEAAMGQARHELGPEAMLLNSRQAPPEARHLGNYEVVFAVDGEAATPGPGGSMPPAAPEDARREPLDGQLAEIRSQLDALHAAIARAPAQLPYWLPPTSPLADLFRGLIATDMDSALVQQVIGAVHDRLADEAAPGTPGRNPAHADPSVLDHLARTYMCRLLTADAALGQGGERPAIIAVVGPAGSGKTATLAKIAARFGLMARRPAQLISTDNYRVAASEQLRCYASILGLGFQVVETPRSLAQALEAHRNKDLILIDTPGFSRFDIADASDLARFFASRPDIDTHLVLPACMKLIDLDRTIERFKTFAPSKLLFTRVDETESFGPILTVAARTGLPLSFLGLGQRVPEDLEPAMPERIVERILPERTKSSALSAA